MRLLVGALLGAPPPFLFGGDSFVAIVSFVAFVVPHALALSARTNKLVIAGHSRSKNGVASLAYDPAIHGAS
jgi:hypothetical protein